MKNRDRITQVNMVIRFMSPWGEEKELSFRIREDQFRLEGKLQDAIDAAMTEWIVKNNPVLLRKLNS